MKLFLSELFTATDINLVEIIKTMTVGAVAIAAIIATGEVAVIAIAFIYLIHLGAAT